MLTNIEKEIEKKAKELHGWYLDATCTDFNNQHCNPKAQKNYDDLTEEQKDIDRYIAKKILAQEIKARIEELAMLGLLGERHKELQAKLKEVEK